jgi:hypothetical protein
MTDVLATMKAELEEGIGCLRLHYPRDSDSQLHDRALSLRPERYAHGSWPTAIAAKEAAEKKDAEARVAVEAAASEALGELGHAADAVDPLTEAPAAALVGI